MKSIQQEHKTPARAPAEDGILLARDMTAKGVSRKRIMEMTRQGELLHIGRGLYSRPDANVTENHTLAQVCARVPHGIICLASALQFHGIGTQNPWQVWTLIEKTARPPRLEYPPLQIVRASGQAFSEGVEESRIEGVIVHVTCIAKTVADCFKYRSRVGLDVALEALKECLSESRVDRALLHHYARVCRVEQIIRPYMEALAI